MLCEGVNMGSIVPDLFQKQIKEHRTYNYTLKQATKTARRWLGCHARASFCETAIHHGGGGHPLFGSQVEPLHEGPGPLSRCQYSCRMNLTMESPPPPTAASPASSSPTSRGRAAAEPSTIDDAMSSMISAASTRLLFFSTAMARLKILSARSVEVLSNAQDDDVGFDTLSSRGRKRYIDYHAYRERGSSHGMDTGMLHCPRKLPTRYVGTTRRGAFELNSLIDE
jgi:hypothetical protein